jgi:YHS domain-containing protein
MRNKLKMWLTFMPHCGTSQMGGTVNLKVQNRMLGRFRMPILSSKRLKWTLLSLLMVVLLVGGGLFIYVQTTTAVISQRVNTDEFGVAILGYDTVAYHTEGRPVKGKSEFSYSWNDAVWHFANTENRNIFATDPDRYAPKYGGF